MTSPANVHWPKKESNRFVQLFQDVAFQPSANRNPNHLQNVSSFSGEQKQWSNPSQVEGDRENEEHAKIKMLRSLKAKSTKKSSAPDINARQNKFENTQDKNNSFQSYYKEVRKATEKLADELGIGINSTLLKDPTHELPDLEVIAPVPKDFEKLRTEYSLRKKEIASMIGDVGEPFGELTNLASNDLQLYIDSISVYRSFFKLVNHLASAVKGRACFGPDDDLQIIKSEESFVRKIKTDTVSRVKEIIKIRDELPTPDLYGAFVDQANIDAIKNLSDVIRGTIIIDSVEQMRSLIKYINYMANSSVYIRAIKYKNIFGETESRPDGYASMHVKLLLAYEDDFGKMRSLMTEIQLQFSSFFNGTHHCPKELMHIIMDYHRKITSGKLQIKEYNKESADAASMLQALLFMKTLKQSIPALPNETTEMVASRNPFKHLLNFLSPQDCANLSQTCHSMRWAQAVAKVRPAMIEAARIQSLLSCAESAGMHANLYPINKRTELTPTINAPSNVEYLVNNKITFGLTFCGTVVGWRLGYVAGVFLADKAGQLLSDPMGWADTPKCRTACITAWYATCLFSIHIGGQWGFFLSNKLGKPVNACLSQIPVICDKLNRIVSKIINPNLINQSSQNVMIYSQKRSVFVTTLTQLGQAIGTLGGGTVGFYVGHDAADIVVKRYMDLVGIRKDPIELNKTLISVLMVWLSTAVGCSLVSGRIGRRLGKDVGEAAGAQLNQVKPFRRVLVSTARALQDGYSPETSPIVIGFTLFGRLVGGYVGGTVCAGTAFNIIRICVTWDVISYIKTGIQKLSLPTEHLNQEVLCFYISYLAEGILWVLAYLFSYKVGNISGAYLGGKAGKFTGTKLYQMYHVYTRLKAYYSGSRW